MAQLIEIQDFMAPELDVYARLTEAQLRNKKEVEKGIFLAESPKVITVALDMGYEPLSMLMELNSSRLVLLLHIKYLIVFSLYKSVLTI